MILDLRDKKITIFFIYVINIINIIKCGLLFFCPRLVRALKMCLQCPEPEVSKQSQTKMPPPPCFPDGVRVENPFYITVL